jgi:hypothetical protein
MTLRNRFLVSLAASLAVAIFITGCASPKILTSTYMNGYVSSDPVTVYPKSNTDNIASAPYITYQRLRADYHVGSEPPSYDSYDEEYTVKSRRDFFSRDYAYFSAIRNRKNEIWNERVQDYEYQFEHSSYIDVAVAFETKKLIPLYRVTITPKRNITQQEIESLPEDGVVSIDRYLSFKPQTFKLKFKYPKNQRLVNGQFVSEWIYCPQCLTNVGVSLGDIKGVAELDRKAEKLFPLYPTTAVYASSYDRQRRQKLNITRVIFKADKNIDSGINKFTTAESMRTQRVMLARISDLKEKKKNAASANARYADFIKSKYEPLTAQYYIKHLHCGYYSEGYRNNPSRDRSELSKNRRYSRCLAKAFEKYDVAGYTQLYPTMKEVEEHLWASTLGAKRVNIMSPRAQVQVFKNRFKDIEKASQVIEGRMSAIAYQRDKAARERKIWSGAFSQAMNNIKQQQAITNNNLLVVDANNNVMTVGEQKRLQLERAKMQAYLDDVKKKSIDKEDKTSTDSKAQSSGGGSGSETGSGSESKQGSTDASATKDAQANEKGMSEKEKQKQEKLEQERLEKEKQEKERLAKQKLENEKREKERLEKERLRKEKLEAKKREQEKIVYNIALTWQNKAGKWFACGPVQCVWAGEDSEDEALNYVTGKQDIVGTTYLYHCKQYKLATMKKHTYADLSEATIRQRSKCAPRK